MKYIVQYSKLSTVTATSLDRLSPDDADKFKFMLAVRAKELKVGSIFYRIK